MSMMQPQGPPQAGDPADRLLHQAAQLIQQYAQAEHDPADKAEAAQILAHIQALIAGDRTSQAHAGPAGPQPSLAQMLGGH